MAEVVQSVKWMLRAINDLIWMPCPHINCSFAGTCKPKKVWRDTGLLPEFSGHQSRKSQSVNFRKRSCHVIRWRVMKKNGDGLQSPHPHPQRDTWSSLCVIIQTHLENEWVSWLHFFNSLQCACHMLIKVYSAFCDLKKQLTVFSEWPPTQDPSAPASHRTAITGIQRCAEHHFCFLFTFIYLRNPEKREKEKMGRKERRKKRTQMESWKAVKLHVHSQDISKFRDRNSNSSPHFQITLDEEIIEAKRITKQNEWKNSITFSNHFFIRNTYNSSVGPTLPYFMLNIAFYTRRHFAWHRHTL